MGLWAKKIQVVMRTEVIREMMIKVRRRRKMWILLNEGDDDSYKERLSAIIIRSAWSYRCSKKAL